MRQFSPLAVLTTRLGKNARRTVPIRARFRPMAERMEDRALLSTFEVLNLSDSGAGSLRAAVAAANADPGSLITFAPGLHGTITLTGGELLIARNVTIAGPGAGKLAISGDNASRVFEIATATNVALSGLTITDGNALDTGGGILNDGGNLALSGVDLTHNVVSEGTTTSGSGGGLYSVAGVVTIANCQITSNQALGASGASNSGAALGGGLYVLGGSLTLSNSTISGNLALGGLNSGDGGAAAGALHTSVPTTINRCTFTDNIAQGGNGAVLGDGTGGAIDVYASNTVITQSTFTGNQAIGGNGGVGAYVGEAEGGAINTYGTLSVDHSTFLHNAAIAGSNGNSGTGTPAPFNNYAFGGAVAVTQANATFTYCTINDNRAVGGNNSHAIGTDITGVGGAEGGGLYNEVQSTLNVANSTLTGNEALGGSGNSATAPVALVGEGLGGGIVNGYGGPGANTAPNPLNVSNSTISNNIAQGGNNNFGSATVTALIGDGAGGGIGNYAGGVATILGSQFNRNQAISGAHNTAGGTGAVFANFAAGGGLFNDLGLYDSATYGVFGTTTANVTNSAFTANDAHGSTFGIGVGGGIFNDATSALALSATSITQNQAAGLASYGGGVYTVGVFSYDVTTVINHNKARTLDNNIAP